MDISEKRKGRAKAVGIVEIKNFKHVCGKIRIDRVENECLMNECSMKVVIIEQHARSVLR